MGEAAGTLRARGLLEAAALPEQCRACRAVRRLLGAERPLCCISQEMALRGGGVRCQKGSPSCLTYVLTVLNVELEEIKRLFALYEKSREGLKAGMVGCGGISTWHVITS